MGLISATYQQIHLDRYNCIGPHHQHRCRRYDMVMTNIRPSLSGTGFQCSHRYSSMNMCWKRGQNPFRTELFICLEVGVTKFQTEIGVVLWCKGKPQNKPLA